jgi:hypothetical protein
MLKLGSTSQIQADQRISPLIETTVAAHPIHLCSLRFRIRWVAFRTC